LTLCGGFKGQEVTAPELPRVIADHQPYGFSIQIQIPPRIGGYVLKDAYCVGVGNGGVIPKSALEYITGDPCREIYAAPINKRGIPGCGLV
jgi:hypothetical protein